MEKALAIIHHFGAGKADFIVRATGKIEWNGPGTEPTEGEIEQWEAERLAYLESVEYASKRAEEYPPIVDQLDYIYHNGIAAWKTAMIKPIKDSYPKP